MKRKKILVTGSGGQLGSSIKSICSHYKRYNFIFKNKDQLDISNFSFFNEEIKKMKIDIIINCAAYTNVTEADKQKQIANITNNLAVKNIVNICQKENIQLIHISTDYVFDGKKQTPYKEDDKTNPLNYYGYTKLEGEQEILKNKLKNSVIIRTSWLYSKNMNNFVKKIINNIKKNKTLKVVSDEFGSPTNSNDLAFFILEIIPLINNTRAEIYNFSNSGICSRIEFAKEILNIIGESKAIEPTFSSLSKINRPKFSALDLTKTKSKFGYDLVDWKKSLKYFLNQ